MRRLDLRDRVTLATAAVLAGGLVVLSAGIMLLLSARLDRDASAVLRERADAQLVAVTQVAGRTVVRPAVDRVIDEPAWIFDVSGRVLRQPRASAAVEDAARALSTVERPVEHDVGEQVRLRAEPARAASGERIGTVVVGVSLRPYERVEHLALLAIALLDVCIVAFGTLIARRVVGKALRPVAEMTAQAADWSERDLDRRFALGPPRDELTALAATLDALLARIASSVRHEQRFSAELAHELRTPLTGVRGEVELALREPGLDPEMRLSLERVVRGADRMARTIDALLTAARGSDVGGGVCDARAAVAAAVEAARPAAERAGVRLTGAAGGGPLRVGAEQKLVEQALAPLIDNAIRHASAAVELRLARDGGDALVTVLDDGPGIPADQREAVFAPGVSSSGGAGLGLPLARRLARSAGGDLTAAAPAAGERGGLLVLRLPAVGSG